MFLRVKKELILLILMIISVLFALYLQYFQEVVPCSLCLLQRWGIYLSIFIIFFVISFKLLKYNITSIILMLLTTFSTFFSVFMALRNVWLQQLPKDKIPSCGADIETLLQIVSPIAAIKQTFLGSGDCADKSWTFLNISLAGWASIYFIFLLILEFYLIYRNIRELKLKR
jgi:disulfide bond formation protein DsbB